MKNGFKIITYVVLILLAVFPTQLHASPPVISNIYSIPALTIQSDVGITNQIQYSTNLSVSNWTVLTNLFVSQSPYVFVDTTATPVGHRFYRVVAIAQPPVAATLGISGLAANVTAGSSANFTVTAKATNGTTVSGYTGTVHFTSSDPQAVLPANYTFTLGDSGTHTFSLNLKTVGIQSVTATDIANSSVNGTQSGIAVSPGAVSVFSFSGFSSTVSAGVQGNLTVTAKDAYGNTAVSYNGTIHFTSSDPQAILPANYTFTGGDAGNHLFSLNLRTAGIQSVTASDSLNVSITGSQSGITVVPGTATNLALFSGNNQIGIAGTSLASPLKVRVTDIGGNPVSGISVTWAATAGGTGVAVGSASTITDASGIASTSATLGSTGGANTFTATVAGLTGSPISFSATAAKSLVVNSGNNQSGTAGTSLASPLVVKVTDNVGNPVAGITVTWAVTTGGTGAAISPNTSVTSGSGLAQATATVGSTPGANTFRATVSGLSGSPVSFSATGL
jgi:hypothetical protein